jgi:hypothetical protein
MVGSQNTASRFSQMKGRSSWLRRMQRPAQRGSRGARGSSLLTVAVPSDNPPQLLRSRRRVEVARPAKWCLRPANRGEAPPPTQLRCAPEHAYILYSALASLSWIAWRDQWHKRSCCATAGIGTTSPSAQNVENGADVPATVSSKAVGTIEHLLNNRINKS